ncbi:MAG: RagB/SusD family nutrient uptake outer membrane protein [Dysgonamonadaceae bacterium]
MNNLFKHTIICAFLIIITMSSCNYLDVADNFEEAFKYDSIFVNKTNLERYTWNIASMFPDEGYKFDKLGSFACDEAFSIMVSDYTSLDYVQGNITPTNLRSFNIWNSMYVIVRKVNTVLNNIDKATDLTGQSKKELMGYLYFMRAYAYYRLIMYYGPIVILSDDVLETNETESYYDRPRATFDESVDYVCNEFERSASLMPEVVSSTFFGRPSAGSALGLCARLRLIQASPLWNGGSAARRTYGTWKRSIDGVYYVSQTYDERKWAQAAAVCKRIIDTNIYSLHTIKKMQDTAPLPDNVSQHNFPLGAGDIDPFRSYADMFTGESPFARNPEYLWAQRSSGLENYSRHAFPYELYNGFATVGVPQKVIDAYLMVDGRTIENSSDKYPYATDGIWNNGADKTFSGYTLKGNVHKMYVNRELRFYASIGFSGAFWPMLSTANLSKRNIQFWYNLNGNAGKNSNRNLPYNVNTTGYSLRKFVHPEDSWGAPGQGEGYENSRRLEKAYPIIRYAEILLAYVEALNNLTTTHTIQDYQLSRNIDEMRYYFNMVRFRAGLPGLTDAELSSKETMQALIERERMVELLHENARFWDVRRWGKYEITEREPIQGMDMDADGLSFYNIVPVNQPIARNRVVDKKLILVPIELNEVRKSPSMDQNPGYQH